MVRKILEKQDIDQVVESLEPQPNIFDVIYDDELKTVSFNLADGTPIIMKEPKAKQVLLLESWRESADTEEEYKTNNFSLVKLASLAITRFGDKDKLTFNDLLDTLRMEDLERVVSAIACFKEFFFYLNERAISEKKKNEELADSLSKEFIQKAL